ncbi:cysteine hydrolase family protein [Nocardioides humi]|uniref:Cysteine hydrolase n=1 Tax=Nocardioides humi TaxID=449461 RepID=A0ABN2AEA1_9ACTN|nr:isochorismatase family cysteine hydrolase [Nocardioides humi]
MTRRHLALLLIDLQEIFVRPPPAVVEAAGELPGIHAVLERTVRLRERARDRGVPVLYTRHVFRPGLVDAPLAARDALRARALERGRPTAEIVAELAPSEEEAVVEKNRHDGFFGTDLAARLRELGVRRLVVAGVVTNLCVETTVRSAVQRDLDVTVAADCTSAPPQAHARSLAAMADAFAVVADSPSLLLGHS